jgi:hypothetical protein
MTLPTEDSTPRLSFLPDFPGRESLYRPLDAASKDEIRVITVQPSNDRSSAIHCSLQTISIQNCQSTKPYDAISYFWGSTLTTEKIFVYDEPPADQHDYCGFEVPVTPALTGALRHFRAKHTESGEPLVLWTDAVCINLRDATERSQQVTIMRNVYKAATLVLVWLGEGDTVAEMGFVNLFGLVMCRQTYMADRGVACEEVRRWKISGNLSVEPCVWDMFMEPSSDRNILCLLDKCGPTGLDAIRSL